MNQPQEAKKRPNRLLQGLVIFSIGIHVVLFLYISGFYRSSALTFIELAISDFKDPVGRAIPHPRIRNKTPEVKTVQKVNMVRQQVPQIQMDPVENSFSNAVTEQISMPNIPGIASNISNWQPVGASQYMTREDYFSMLRMKIESHKKYPDTARKRQVEGKVEVGFAIDRDGSVTGVEILKSSRNPDLDRAALTAVKTAAPFPRPPTKLFSSVLKINIVIMFELM